MPWVIRGLSGYSTLRKPSSGSGVYIVLSKMSDDVSAQLFHQCAFNDSCSFDKANNKARTCSVTCTVGRSVVVRSILLYLFCSQFLGASTTIYLFRNSFVSPNRRLRKKRSKYSELRMMPFLQVLIVGAYQRITEIPRMLGEQVVCYVKTHRT